MGGGTWYILCCHLCKICGCRIPRSFSGKEPVCHCRRHERRGFNPWVRKIPRRRAWQPPPVFLPGESHGQRSPVGCSPEDHKGCRGHKWGDLARTQDLPSPGAGYAERIRLVPIPGKRWGLAPKQSFLEDRISVPFRSRLFCWTVLHGAGLGTWELGLPGRGAVAVSLTHLRTSGKLCSPL